MIAGAPHEARWVRPTPGYTFLSADLERIVQTAFPGSGLLNWKRLGEGLRNTNLLLQLNQPPGQVVLRVYEHDTSLCQKEVDVLRMLSRIVPVPEVIYSDPRGSNETTSFTLYRYCAGITLRELLHSANKESIPQAAYSCGRTLALLGRFTFAKAGWLGPGVKVTKPFLEDTNLIPCFVEHCCESSNLQERTPPNFRDRVTAFVWSRSSQFELLDTTASLVHGDFGKRNLLVSSAGEGWHVSAVLDWEFAFAGSPLVDVGHFLRYERSSRPRLEPHFSNGFSDGGGKLPEGWRQLARLLDLTELCESLTHNHLPSDVSAELVELILATIESRDPE